jgi:hypothetical protein
MRPRFCQLIAALIVAGLASGSVQAADESRTIEDNESIFVDGRAFKITPGKAIGSAAAQIGRLGARELGPGALIFRSGSKLFIVDTPLQLPGAGPAGSSRVYVGAASRPNRIRIEYVPPKKPEFQSLYELVKEHRALEALQQVLSPFRLPEDLTIRTTECGMANAWYRREETGPAITLCYEYLQAIQNNLPQETTPSGITRIDAIVGQFFYVVVHEFGHAVFEIYDISIFGRDEDAADQFASYILLQFGKERSRRLVGGAAYSFRKYVTAIKEKPKVTMPLAAFSSTHAQPEQRFFNLLCTAYGADPKEFAYLVDDEFLPKTRAQRCEYEFSKLSASIQRHLRPHVDQELARKVMDTKWIDFMGISDPRETIGRAK